MNTFQNQINQYEREQAKKRMGTFGGANAGTGFTNNVSGNVGTGMTSGTTPTLSSSKAVGAGEVQKAKEKMNKPSMY